MTKWITLAAGIAIAAATVAMFYLRDGLPVQTTAARIDSIQELIDERGTTRLPKEYLITMPYDGWVMPIDSVENDSVAKGQIVARVVPEDVATSLAAAQAAYDRLTASIEENAYLAVEKTLQLQAGSYVESMKAAVEAAEARMTAGKAKADYARTNLDRVRALKEQRAATDEELDRAKLLLVESDVDYQQDRLIHRAMQAMYAATSLAPRMVGEYIDGKALTGKVLVEQRDEAAAHLDQVKQNERRSEMTSPIDGVVLERLVSNKGPAATGTVLLRIGDLGQLEIETDLLSEDVGRVAIGNRAEIHGAAIGERPASAQVVRIHPAGFTKLSSLGVEQQRVRVVLRMDESDLAEARKYRNLGVGFRVRVRIFTERRDKALVVPRSALFRNADQEWQTMVVRGGRARRQTVKIGLSNDRMGEVVEGLEAGDVVVLAPPSELVDGMRVSVE
jgi:HlyD family secretion protein